MAPTNESARARPRLSKLAALAAVGTLLAASAVGLSATAASAAENGIGVSSNFGGAYCTDGGAAVDVSVTVSPAQAGIQAYVNVSTEHGHWDELGGPTGADGVYRVTVPLVDGAVTNVTVGAIGTDTWPQWENPSPGTAFYAGDVDYPFPAECAPATPSLSLSASTVAPGDALTISVTGAQAGEQLSVMLHSDPVTLGTVTADQNGTASLTATIPSTVPAGTHTVKVDGEVTHLEKAITVTEASTPTAPVDPTNPQPVDQSGHKTPTTVQTDGNQAPVLWLTTSVLLMALATAGGAGFVWRRVRR